MLKKAVGLVKTFFRKFLVFVRKPKGMIITGIGVILFGFLLSMTQGNPLEAFDIGQVERKDIISIVDLTGRIEPAEQVDMALERGGRVSHINVEIGEEVSKGETLLGVGNADLYADLAQAQASLEIAKLELDRIKETSVIDEDSAFTDLMNTLEDSYAATSNALSNKLSGIYRGSASSGSTSIGIVTSDGVTIKLNLSLTDRLDLSYHKRRLDKSIVSWRISLDSINQDSAQDVADMAEVVAVDAQSLINELTSAFNSYRTDIANYQSAIDVERANLFTASSLISGALTDIRNAKQDYQSALASLGSVSSNDSLRDVLLQEQRVKNTQAGVNAVWAEINKTLVRAPFDGVITKIDTEVGEIVSSSVPVISMMSKSTFEIEGYIPEADVADVSVGDLADITLDAYTSEDIFKAEVVFIDPAETIIEGVSTYRVLLHFTAEDERIRSGMTANIDIITGSREGVLVIPQRAVIEKRGKRMVRVVNGDETSEVEVVIGLRGSEGEVEIMEGLNEGDKIVVFVRG